MSPRDLEPGDVVQIDPESGGFFSGCFMLVTEPKSWGAQGFISIPRSRDELPGRAFFRARFDQMEYVGKAEWVPKGPEGE